MPCRKMIRWPLAAATIAILIASQSLGQGFPGGRGGGGGKGGPQGPRDVGTITVTQEDVPYVVTLPGRAVAFQETGIRPQVGGELREVVYHPGQPVKIGDVLFRIDPETLAAALSAAEAQVSGAEASLSSAQATVERYRKLERSSVSSVDLTNAEVSLKQAQAQLKSAEAARDTAALALKRTEITSPIDGMPDVPQVSVGDILTANQAAVLTTITQIDPIYVDVTQSSARILKARERVEAGSLSPADGFDMSLRLETGEAYSGKGQLVSPGITVSPTTGTVPIRLQFDNAQGLILPGQFLRVELTMGQTRAVLIPQRATRRASDGTLTAFVARDGKAQQVTLTEAGSYRNSWIVTQGISEGEQVILDGLENLRVGAEVKPLPVTIDQNGVVRDSAPTTGAATDAPAGQAGAPSGQGSDGSGARGTRGAAQQSGTPAATTAAEPTAGTTTADAPAAASATDTAPAPVAQARKAD
ncbi:efflux RND transporter periplasmic adaptor subunit [Paracoccus aminophilus]|uniref:RND family efflux transporter MFP subunit n=1 Tax=Paracoccus aminophilus JCM 7686 TaxID=1367847 RepID=S5YFQ7_PARAH|nr:efflux RND transporter periplasmic adaptor subunit [Paracoccus aminophilus]AGT10313.1 RND family efflux transporter MFP subunit [Paracoccus aminophilus JCM 7686]